MEDTRFRLSHERAKELANTFGTPLYVLDEKSLRTTIKRYVSAAKQAYSKSEVIYASKANSTLAVIAVAYSEGCAIDVASEGELRAALAAGVPASRCYVHGNNKSEAELEFALQSGVGQLAIDNFEEIELLKALLPPHTEQPKLLIRLAPGVDPITHKKISTGQEDSKFGFNIADGSAEKALRLCLEAKLPVIGFHCHVGSQLLDPEAQRAGGERLAQFAVRMLAEYGFRTEVLNIGGGLGVKYLDSDEPMPVEDYCRIIERAIADVLAGSGLEPTIAQEPGRALVAESCLTLYRVGVVKPVPIVGGIRTYVAVDGGLSDNPRPALYDAEYTIEHIPDSGVRRSALGVDVASLDHQHGGTERTEDTERSGRSMQVTVTGKHCETDDLFVDVLVGEDIQRGDLIQVLCTGAYNSSMASNYNRYPRPAAVLIRENGEAVLVQRPETWDEMLSRDILPFG